MHVTADRYESSPFAAMKAANSVKTYWRTKWIYSRLDIGVTSSMRPILNPPLAKARIAARSWNSWTNSTHGSNSDVKCCKSLCTWSLYDRVCSFHCSKRWWLVSIGRYVHSTRAYRYGFSTSKVSHVDNRIVVTAKNMCNSPLFFCFCRITFIRFWGCIA